MSFQCGGEGNIAALHATAIAAAADCGLGDRFAGWPGPWNFAGPEETVPRLEAAGFVDAHAGLHDEPVHPEDPHEFLATVILGAHLDRLPSELHNAFVDRVLAELQEPVTVKYVRLTMSARTPTAS
jgi:trans-aconitate 2-methyltransferase